MTDETRTPESQTDATPGTGTGTGTGTGPEAGATGGASNGARTFTEEFRVSGEKVVETVKELLREGNVRRITLKNDEGKTLIEIPLTLGVIGTLLLPVWAGIGAIAALVANLTIAVEKVEKIATDAADAPEAGEAPAAPEAAEGPAT